MANSTNSDDPAENAPNDRETDRPKSRPRKSRERTVEAAERLRREAVAPVRAANEAQRQSQFARQADAIGGAARPMREAVDAAERMRRELDAPARAAQDALRQEQLARQAAAMEATTRPMREAAEHLRRSVAMPFDFGAAETPPTRDAKRAVT